MFSLPDFCPLLTLLPTTFNYTSNFSWVTKELQNELRDSDEKWMEERRKSARPTFDIKKGWWTELYKTNIAGGKFFSHAMHSLPSIASRLNAFFSVVFFVPSPPSSRQKMRNLYCTLWKVSRSHWPFFCLYLLLTYAYVYYSQTTTIQRVAILAHSIEYFFIIIKIEIWFYLFKVWKTRWRKTTTSIWSWEWKERKKTTGLEFPQCKKKSESTFCKYIYTKRRRERDIEHST